MTTEKQKEKLMTELARSFPVLDAKFDDAKNNGLEPWNFLQLANVSGQWSSTEKMVVSFLATVWNVHDAKDFVEPFCVVKASRSFDNENWEAFAKWVADPFTC